MKNSFSFYFLLRSPWKEFFGGATQRNENDADDKRTTRNFKKRPKNTLLLAFWNWIFLTLLFSLNYRNKEEKWSDEKNSVIFIIRKNNMVID